MYIESYTIIQLVVPFKQMHVEGRQPQTEKTLKIVLKTRGSKFTSNKWTQGTGDVKISQNSHSEILDKRVKSSRRANGLVPTCKQCSYKTVLKQ